MDNLEKLVKRMEKLGIKEEDLIEKFILGTGKGGQKINKTSSCVYLKHIPSSIEIKCQAFRSREDNRLHVRQELCERLERITHQKIGEEKSAKEKKRRQNRPRSKAEKENIKTIKKIRTEKKVLRKKPQFD